LSTLTLVSESFVSDKFRASFSDLVYTCETKTGEILRICLLIEHKSTNPGRRIYPQVSRYLIDIQDEDINQGRENFTLTIPIIFYHGKDPWNPGTIFSQYGPIPESVQEFALRYNFITVNLRNMTDEEIMGMQNAQLLRNIFLAMKHAWEDDFFRENFQKVVIFADENVSEEILLSLFLGTYLYIQMVSSIKKEEIMSMVQTLPPQYEQRVKSTYEQIWEETMEKGMQQGVQQGIQQALHQVIRNFIVNCPSFTDKEVATMLGVEEVLVQQVRKAI
jgi:predicted transposase/invertase (TIGR01784 family)